MSETNLLLYSVKKLEFEIDGVTVDVNKFMMAKRISKKHIRILYESCKDELGKLVELILYLITFLIMRIFDQRHQKRTFRNFKTKSSRQTGLKFMKISSS